MTDTASEKLALTSTDPLKEDGTTRHAVWEFLEGRGPGGATYERFSIVLILVNVLAFIAGSMFDKEYNIYPETGKYKGPECSWCDVVFFGNEADNGMSGTSILEAVTAVCFTIDWCLRYWSCLEVPEEYPTRFTYVVSFFSIIDLVSTVPFYVELCFPIEISATQFLRMFRLFRMMRVEGRYAEAFTLFDDVVAAKKNVMITASFVGAVVWVILSGFYYVACRYNQQMIYCPECPDVDVMQCKIDTWGFVDCAAGLAAAKCPSTVTCWNLYESIPDSMFQTLLNLFGEFPLASQQQGWGMVISIFAAVVAQVVFGIPCGIIGSGFEEQLQNRKQTEATPLADTAQADYGTMENAPTGDPEVSGDSFREQTYRFIHGKNGAGEIFDYVIVTLIITSTLSFMFETLQVVNTNPFLSTSLYILEWFTVIVFTFEYIADAYSIGADPAFSGFHGLWKHLSSPLKLIDLLSILPFYISELYGGQGAVFVRSLRLIRIVKTEHFINAFSVLESVIIEQSDVLIITGFAAMVFWVFFSALMYFAERQNPDAEMMSYYSTIPQAMWVTLLNLSGECPLAMYTTMGKWLLGIMGIFAVGFISIPVGVLAAGFQSYAEDHGEDSPSEEEAPQEDPSSGDNVTPIQKFVAEQTPVGLLFGRLVLLLIFATVGLAIMETVPGYQCDGANAGSSTCVVFDFLESFSVVVFTLEYLLRFIAAPSKFDYVFSFYSMIDLLAIVPWYVAVADPGGWVDQQNTLFLTFRVLRLLKLDKEVPSLTLIDDVFRLKRDALVVTGIIAGILWILFSSMMYVAESQDFVQAIDAMPLEGCIDNCTEAVRYKNVFSAATFVNIHLIGDYPIIQYNIWGRIICFFMVVVGAGIVSIPSGLIADGFSAIIAKQQKKTGEDTLKREYDIKLQNLRGEDPPREFHSDALDKLQTDVNTFLNGTADKKGKNITRTPMSKLMNQAVLVAIILNVACVILESVPRINKSVGNGSSNIFDLLEFLCVMLFTAEYALRMFSVTKDIIHLYSRWVYATTFFGIVDLVTIAPFYVALLLSLCGVPLGKDATDAFRLVRLFRLLELEHFVTAFTVLDNVFYRSRGALLATGVLAFVIWLVCGTLFYLFEYDNPNWCTAWLDPACDTKWTKDCVCAAPSTFDTLPHSLYFTAIFLAGEWAVCDFTVMGKLVCIFLCVIGIGLAALPIGSLFDSFANVLEEGGDLDAADAADAEDAA